MSLSCHYQIRTWSTWFSRCSMAIKTMLSLWLTQRLKFFLNLFPECVARVPLSLWRSVEVWGLRVCLLDVAFTFATVRNRSQPFATVRNRSQPFMWGPYGHAYGEFCKRGRFWMFPASQSFVSGGRRGTSWHSDVFRNVSKVVFCGRRNTFATFSEDALHFSWQAQHFGDLHRPFAW